MKLVMAVVQDKDSGKLSQALVQRGIRATKLASTGGFLRSGNTTFLIGTEDDQVESLIQLIEANCHSRKQLVSPMAGLGSSAETYIPHPVEVEVGGATVFVLNVDKFLHF